MCFADVVIAILVALISGVLISIGEVSCIVLSISELLFGRASLSWCLGLFVSFDCCKHNESSVSLLLYNLVFNLVIQDKRIYTTKAFRGPL